MNSQPDQQQPQCFHCGLPIPARVNFPVRLNDHSAATCCAGCQAVAQTIIDNGLGEYYQHRQNTAGKVDPLPDEVLQQLKLYDNDEIQHSFVLNESTETREAALILEGITCSACVWLNERHLSGIKGVLSADINYTSHRARVRWDNTQIKLSQILEAIASIGYRAHPFDAARQEALAQQERKTALLRIYLAGLSMMQVMMYAVPLYVAEAGDMSRDMEGLMRWASLILTLPVVLYSSIPFYQGSWRDLKAGRAGMDVPVALGVLTAFAASTWATITQSGEVYFDSVSMFVFLLLGGRYLEMLARRKAGSAVEKLVKLIPSFAHRLPDYPQDKAPQEAAVAQLQVGDYLLVREGEIIPADGIIIEGNTQVDEALLTGEG
ncbi:MAG: heavy metal translocating P-type ATPase, partial [Neisseriaceae bacterium]